MTAFTLTPSLIAALCLTTFGQNHATLRSQISTKEKQLAEIQKELHELRSNLDDETSGGHIVRSGETLHSIAQRHQVSVSDIMKWNSITDPTKLRVGAKIIVSSARSSLIATTSKNEKPASSAKRADYVIAQGDTFYSIARRHNMTLAQLRELNPNVSTHLLSPGKTLRVSGNPATAASASTKKKVVVFEKTLKPEEKNSTPKPPTPAVTARETARPTEKVADKPADPQPERLPEPPVVQEAAPAVTTKSIILTDVITFEAFASKHGTDTKHLNSLNGWNLPKSTVLAGGSEILVPN